MVDNDPAKEFRGEDQQLDRAIEEIQEELKTKALRSAAGPALSESQSNALSLITGELFLTDCKDNLVGERLETQIAVLL